MEELTIGEVAQRAGIRASAIRYYESVALLPAPQRINRRRRYDSTVFERLAVIQLAQQAGFTVSEIRTLFNGFTPETPASARWEALAQQKLAEVNALIRRSQAMKRLLEEQLLRCRCLTLEECARCICERSIHLPNLPEDFENYYLWVDYVLHCSQNPLEMREP